MKTKDVLLAAFLILGFALIVKGLQVAVTDEFWAWLTVAADRLLASAGVKVLVFCIGVLFCLSLIAASWERSEARHARWEAEQARARALREEQIRSTDARESLTDPLDSNEPIDRGRPAA